MKCSITFDDGPTVPETDNILDILKEHSVLATFFLIGERVAQYPHIVRRIYTEGHHIGNHTYSHQSLLGLSNEAMEQEIVHTQQEIMHITSEEPKLFRAPYGEYDDRTKHLCEMHGLQIVLWDVDSKDWKSSSDNIVHTVLDRAGKGSIILLHTIPQTVQALPRILEGLRGKELI